MRRNLRLLLGFFVKTRNTGVSLRFVRASPSRNGGALCRERRSKTAKTVRWTVFSESPSNYVAKAEGSANAHSSAPLRYAPERLRRSSQRSCKKILFPIEVPLFTKKWKEIGLDDSDLLKLQQTGGNLFHYLKICVQD